MEWFCISFTKIKLRIVTSHIAKFSIFFKIYWPTKWDYTKKKQRYIVRSTTEYACFYLKCSISFNLTFLSNWRILQRRQNLAFIWPISFYDKRFVCRNLKEEGSWLGMGSLWEIIYVVVIEKANLTLSLVPFIFILFFYLNKHLYYKIVIYLQENKPLTYYKLLFSQFNAFVLLPVHYFSFLSQIHIILVLLMI